MTGPFATGLPGGHSEWEPPDPFSNSEVKTLCADASVDFVDVKVGHCQALNLMKMKPSPAQAGEGFFRAVKRSPHLRPPNIRVVPEWHQTPLRSKSLCWLLVAKRWVNNP